jgi:hypothetical protein
LPVANAMSAQPTPEASHCCHWYVTVGGGIAVHVPAAAVNV